MVVKEIGSGVNDTRPKLIKLKLLAMQGRRIEVINLAENGKEDLVQDFVSIVTSFCARLYGQQRSKR